jgi:hypothetical protein
LMNVRDQLQWHWTVLWYYHKCILYLQFLNWPNIYPVYWSLTV